MLRQRRSNGFAMINAGHFIDSEFPARFRALIPAALKAAYVAVDDLYKTEVIFQARSALAEKGHAIHWAVDHQIERLLKTRKLPFDYRWISYERPTGEYLQIRLPTATMSISQLPYPTNVPRHAFFRHNRALNNSPFLNLPEFDDERQITGLPHLILAHGHQNLSFAYVGLPHWSNSEWTYRTPNLLNAPHLIVSDESKVEASDVEAVVTLRDELSRWARDNANDE
jgi:hypothetical protein